MGRSYSDGAVFANNFMTGFSFVDEIKRNKKRDAQLERRLEEERNERAFQRRRQQRSDARIDTLFGQQQEDRKDDLEEERLREEGDSFALQNPDATPEELAPYAPYSTKAAAALERQNKTARINRALRDGLTIGQAGATQSQGATSLSEGVAQVVDPATAQAAGGQAPNQQGASANPAIDLARQEAGMRNDPAGFTFGADRSPANLVSVDIDDASAYDPEFQKKSGWQKVGDRVAGIGAELHRGIGETAGAASQLMAGTPPGLGRRQANIQDEFGGNLRLPADRYTRPEEIQALVDAGEMTPEKAQQIREQNAATLQEYKEKGRRPRPFAMDATSRQGLLLEGSDVAMGEARREAAKVKQHAMDFVDPTVESKLEEMATTDVRGAAVMYLEDRATLKSTDPNLAAQADMRAVPILDAAQEDMIEELKGLPPESPQYRQTSQALKNLHASRDQIAAEHPGIAQQANIRAPGVKVGDTQRVQDVVEVIYDGERVSRRHHPAGKIKAAAAVAQRISPTTKRLNDKQIEALAVLADSGWMSKQTAMSVMMNGGWPPGKDPNAIIKLQTENGVTYGQTNSGKFIVVDEGTKRNSKPKPTREITRQQMDWAVEGYKLHNPGADDRESASAAAFMVENPTFMRTNYAVGSQEQMRSFGMNWAIAKQTEAASKRHADNDWNFTTGSGDPDDYWDAVEIMWSNEDERAELAKNLGMKMVNIPDPFSLIQGIDPEEIYQAVEEGVYGQQYVDDARNYTIDQLAEILTKDAYMQEQVLEAQRRRQ